MREPTDLAREEYELTKVALERSDVPAEALALLSAWIEGERLLVDDRDGVGGDRLLPHGFKAHGAASSHLHLIFRPPSLQAQSRALSHLERLLSAAVPGCGGGLEADADTEGLLLRSVCSGVRS